MDGPNPLSIQPSCPAKLSAVLSATGDLRRDLAALPRAAWVLFFGTFVNRFGGFVMPFLILWLTDRGWDERIAAAAISCYGAGHLVASLGGGWLADRIGRRPTIVLSMLGSGVSMIWLFHAGGIAMTLLASFVAGTTAEAYRPAATAMVADLVPPEHRITAFAMYRLAINLGFAAGPAAAGFMAEHSFALLFWGDALTSFAWAAIAMIFLPAGVAASGAQTRWIAALRVIRRDGRFVLFLIATLLGALILFQFEAAMPLHLRAAGYPARVYGMLLSLNGLLIITLEILITGWTRRADLRRVMSLGFLLMGIGMAMTGLSTALPMVAISVVVWTFGEMIYSPVAGAWVAGIAPLDQRGRYMGLYSLMYSFGLIAGPALGAMLWRYDPRLLWSLIALLGVAAALIVLRIQPDAGAREQGSQV